MTLCGGRHLFSQCDLEMQHLPDEQSNHGSAVLYFLAPILIVCYGMLLAAQCMSKLAQMPGSTRSPVQSSSQRGPLRDHGRGNNCLWLGH